MRKRHVPQTSATKLSSRLSDGEELDTPTSAWWLNLVERFFGELTERQIRRLRVTGVAPRITAITAHTNQRNANPIPFVRTTTVKQIFKKVGKASKTLATPHLHVSDAHDQAAATWRGRAPAAATVAPLHTPERRVCA